MQTLYFNKFTNWTKDFTYVESDRKDLDYFTQRLYSECEYNQIVKMNIEEIKDLINKII